MVKYLFKSPLLLVVYLFLVSSCSTLPFFPMSSPKPRSDWITKWLRNPTCQPPCWENLIPGKTMVNDGIIILIKIPGVHITMYPSKGPIGNEKQMDWQFGPSSGSLSAITDNRGELISTISLNFNTDENITVDEIVSAYGPPTNVSFFDCRTILKVKSCEIHLIYKDKGMAVEFLINDIGEYLRQK